MHNELFDFLIIRYGEIGLKSKKVRRKLENTLVNRIRQVLQRKNISYEKLQLLPTRGRLFLHIKDIAKASEELRKCFGIVSFSPSFQVSSNKNEICDGALKLAESIFKDKETFAVRTKRVGKHPYSSQDISVEVGAHLLENYSDRQISVNLSKPDHTIHIEIRDAKAFIFNQIDRGLAGLPYGSQGTLVALISGGIDSPVASWLMMKRGCDIIPLYCDLNPFTTEAANERVVKGLRQLFEYSPYRKVSLYISPHGPILEKVREFIPLKLNCLFCKRIMYRIAEKLANKVKAKGIVTGENLGQVASQTLDNLYVLNQATNLPVFRPLIGFDKSEIIELSEKLGLYSSSIMKAPGCSAVPQYPETHGILEDILKIEKEHEIQELIDEGFQNIKEMKISLYP